MSYEHVVSPTYIIFKEDSKYLARNGKTGVIDYYGTDAGAVINSVISAIPSSGSIRVKGEVNTTTSILFNGGGAAGGWGKWLTFTFDRINVDANVDGVVVTNWARPLKIRGSLLLNTTANASNALLKFTGVVEHVDVDIGQLNGDGTYGKVKGIQVEGTTGTWFMHNKIRIRKNYYLEKVLYMNFIDNSWASINKFDLGWFEGQSPRQIHLYKAGTDSIHQNVISGSGGNQNGWNPQSLTPIWVIRLETDATGQIVGTTFEDFAIYSGVDEMYREIGNVNRTRFIGGMLEQTFQNRWHSNLGTLDFIGVSQGASNELLTCFSNLDITQSSVIPPNAGWETSYVGSGSAAFYPFRIYLVTGTTANSCGLVRCGIHGLNAGSIHQEYIDWTRRLQLSFFLTRVSDDPQVIGRVQLKEINTEGQLAQRGIGLQINNWSVIGEAYGTARNTTAEIKSLLGARIARIKIVKLSDKVEFWVNDYLKATLTGTAVPNVTGNASAYLVASIINGATGGVSAALNISNIQINYDYRNM
jgi:hypothetical protein